MKTGLETLAKLLADVMMLQPSESHPVKKEKKNIHITNGDVCKIGNYLRAFSW